MPEFTACSDKLYAGPLLATVALLTKALVMGERKGIYKEGTMLC
jgi:hypothetical protein